MYIQPILLFQSQFIKTVKCLDLSIKNNLTLLNTFNQHQHKTIKAQQGNSITTIIIVEYKIEEIEEYTDSDMNKPKLKWYRQINQRNRTN